MRRMPSLAARAGMSAAPAMSKTISWPQTGSSSGAAWRGARHLGAHEADPEEAGDDGAEGVLEAGEVVGAAHGHVGDDGGEAAPVGAHDGRGQLAVGGLGEAVEVEAEVGRLVQDEAEAELAAGVGDGRVVGGVELAADGEAAVAPAGLEAVGVAEGVVLDGVEADGRDRPSSAGRCRRGPARRRPPPPAGEDAEPGPPLEHVAGVGGGEAGQVVQPFEDARLSRGVRADEDGEAVELDLDVPERLEVPEADGVDHGGSLYAAPSGP